MNAVEVLAAGEHVAARAAGRAAATELVERLRTGAAQPGELHRRVVAEMGSFRQSIEPVWMSGFLEVFEALARESRA